MCQTFLANSYVFFFLNFKFYFYPLVPSSPTSWKYLCFASPRFSKIQWKRRRGEEARDPSHHQLISHKLPEELEQPKRTAILPTFMIYLIPIFIYHLFTSFSTSPISPTNWNTSNTSLQSSVKLL